MGDKQIQEQVMKAQGYAIDIEYTLRVIFKCDQYGFGGQISANSIRKHPFLSMTQGLAYLYAIYPHKLDEIERFNDHFNFYSNMSLDDLLSFDTNEKTTGIETIQIEKKNGLEQVEYMINEFNKIVK